LENGGDLGAEVSLTHSTEGGISWLYARIEELGYASLTEFARETGFNKGNLHRYFSWTTRPSIAQLPKLRSALKVSTDELLTALGISD